MQEQLMQLKNDCLSLIIDADDSKTLEQVYLQFLGRSGKLTTLLKELPKLPLEERGPLGRVANEVKTIITDAIAQKQKSLQSSHITKQKSLLDVTDPGIKPPLGHLHLVTQAIDEISAIFEKIGLSRVRYPEIEWDWYAFTALNFPEDHPARDDWETFFMEEEAHKTYGRMILTPHTSSGQIREMQRIKPPVRMINIAKTYRRQSDTRHTQMFHQFEGLVVDKGISITHLRGVLNHFMKSFYGEDRNFRIRPYHFQFTEPSFEVDVDCGVCHGTGKLTNGDTCRVCKGGWMELGGAGMVHPNVLKSVGIDPNEYSGFAFGWGVERCMMMKEGLELNDLRLMYGNSLEFLEQF